MNFNVFLQYNECDGVLLLFYLNHENQLTIYVVCWEDNIIKYKRLLVGRFLIIDLHNSTDLNNVQ